MAFSLAPPPASHISPPVRLPSSSPFAPPLVNVTLNNYSTTYVYAASKLWLSYGIGIFLATIAVAIGISALIANGASYSFSFSTVLRVLQNAELSEEVKEEDWGGYDPLPSYLAKAKIRFKESSSGHSSAADRAEKPDDKASLLLRHGLSKSSSEQSVAAKLVTWKLANASSQSEDTLA